MMKQCSTRVAQKQQGVMNSKDDKISQLPDEILVFILSLITMKEAARTSVLSRRWTKLWYFIPTLDFDASEPLKHKQQPILFAEKSIKYVNSVNLVLGSHQGATLDEFNLRLDLDASYSRDIDAWVKFACQKKVKCLTINLAKYEKHWRLGPDYRFPSLCNTDFAFLRKLCLQSINIDAKSVEHFISTCPHLEDLAIVGSYSQHLEHLNIAGASLCLKHLKIGHCTNLESIHLSATNLSSFEYIGPKIDISYANVPKLVKVKIFGIFIKPIFFNFQQVFPNYLPGVETLQLQLECIPKYMTRVNFYFPELPYLKNLILEADGSKEWSLLNLDFFLKKSPSLSRVKLIMHYDKYYSSTEEKDVMIEGYECPLWCLKEIKVVGFEGHAMETEFLSYLFENTTTTTLEKISIDCLPLRYADMPMDYDLLKQIESIRKHAATKLMRFFESEYCSLRDNLVLQNF